MNRLGDMQAEGTFMRLIYNLSFNTLTSWLVRKQPKDSPTSKEVFVYDKGIGQLIKCNKYIKIKLVFIILNDL